MEKRSPEGWAAKRAYNARYNAQNYEGIHLMVKKGERSRLKKQAARHNMSMASYVVTACDEYDVNN